MISKKIVLTFSLIQLAMVLARGQELTYYDDIEPIIRTNCASCHKPNGYGPFSLTTYEEVKTKGSFIAHVTKTKYMPPWKADPEFRKFKNQRILKPEEIEKINTWVTMGMPKGKKKKNETPIPNQISDSPADLIIEMQEPYLLSDKSIEDFRFFNIPTNLPNDVYLKAIEFVPGNKKRVHHSRIMADTSNLIRAIDGLSEMDPKIKEFQKIPLADEFLYGWVPGNLPITYPVGTGKKLKANTDLILNIHYAPTSKEQADQSKIKLYFSKEEIFNDINVLVLRENDISNQPFYIKADTKPTFYVSYTLDKDINIVSVMPHMHFLGNSITALAATPNGDAIPLIKIDKWDFNWQSTYLYDEPLFLPAGTVLLVTANYDNTTENKANINNPPKDVGYGWNSTDEMMNLVLYYY